jgi:hypothetical protein
MTRAAWSLALVLGLAGVLAAAPQPRPTPPGEAVSRRFLLRLEPDRGPAWFAVADAWARNVNGRQVDWRLTVTYYPAQGRIKPGDIITRQYGSTVGNQAGKDNVGLDLGAYSARLDLPVPGGDRTVSLSGGLNAAGQWDLQGSRRDDGKAGPPDRARVWSVRSVRRIQLKGIDLRD